MNLVELCKSQLGGAALSQLAGVLGMDRNDAERATKAAAPSLLAALAGVASTPEGAQRLESAVDAADSPGDAMAAISGGGDLLKQGGNLLSSVLGGGNALSNLGNVRGKFTGMGAGSIMSLLGAIGPMILGVLKGQKQSLGLQSGGIANLLASQKNNIAAALPPGLGSMLGGAGIPGLSSIVDMASRATGAASSAGHNAYDSGREALAGAGRAAQAGASSAAKWAIPLLGLLVVGSLIWWIASSSRAPQVPPPLTDAARAIKDSANKAVDSADATLASARMAANDLATKLATDTTDSFTGVTTSLANITDAASADASIPKLKDLSDKLDAIKSSMGSLSTDSRTSLINSIRPHADKLIAALDKVTSVPGVADKLRPYVQPVRDKLSALLAPAPSTP